MRRKKRRTKAQKEIALHDLLRLLRRGLSKREAARQLGVDEKQVRRDWEELVRRLNTESGKDLESMLEQYREVKAEAWATWDRSKQTKERSVAEKTTQPGGAGQASVDRVKVVKVAEGRLPDNSYLETVRKVLDKECELLGLNPPRNLNLTVEELDRAIEVELTKLAGSRSPDT